MTRTTSELFDGKSCSLRSKGFQAASVSKAAGFVFPQQFQFVIVETINVKERGTTVARRPTRNVRKHNNSFRAFVACDICYVDVRETEPATVRFYVVFVFAVCQRDVYVPAIPKSVRVGKTLEVESVEIVRNKLRQSEHDQE